MKDEISASPIHIPQDLTQQDLTQPGPFWKAKEQVIMTQATPHIRILAILHVPTILRLEEVMIKEEYMWFLPLPTEWF